LANITLQRIVCTPNVSAINSDLLTSLHKNTKSVFAQGSRRRLGFSTGRLGNWLSAEQAEELIRSPDLQTIIGKRDHTILALLLGCALRQSEAAHLTSERFKRRDDYWAIVDIFGKGGHIRSVPVPNWVEHAVDCLAEAARFHAVTET